MNNPLLVKDLASELMLYNLERDEVHILNPSAKRIYQLWEKGRTVSEIEVVIRETFQAEAEDDLTGDIRSCLKELKEKGLLLRGEH